MAADGAQVAAASVARAAHRYRWVMMALWFLAFFGYALHRFALAPIVPTITAEFNLSYAAAGALTSSWFLAYAVMQLPSGVLADRAGPRRMLLVCLAITSFAVLPFALSPTFEVALALRIIIGMGASGIWPSILKMMFTWFDRRDIPLGTSVVNASGPLADVVTLWAMPVLALAFGWRLGYFGLAITAPIILVLCWRFMRPAPGSAAAVAPAPSSKLLDDLRVVLGSRRLWLLSSAQLLFFGGYIGMLAWMPSYYNRELGYGKAEAGFLAGCVSLAMLISLPLCGMLAGRFVRQERVYVAGMFFTIVLVALLPVIAGRIGYGGMIGMNLLIGMSLAPLILPYSMLISHVPVPLAGAATGLVNSLAYGANFVYPIVLGAVVDATGSLTLIFPFVAASTLVAALLALRYSRGAVRGEA